MVFLFKLLTKEEKTLRKAGCTTSSPSTIFHTLSLCLEKSKDDSIMKSTNDVINLFFTDLLNNLEFILSDIGSLMKVTTLLMNSKNQQISESSHMNLKKLITIFSQMFGMKIDENSKKLMENSAKIESMAVICKQYIEGDKLLAIILIPVLETLLKVPGKQKKDLESGVELGLDILRSFSKELKKQAWQLVFSKVLNPFVTESVKESNKLLLSGASPKEDYFHKLLKVTLKDLYFLISESKDKEIILDYMKFLEEKIETSDKNLVDMYFETVLDVLRHHLYSDVTTSMIQLVCTTIEKSIPNLLFENSISRTIRSENLREKPQNQRVTPEAIAINFDTSKVVSSLNILLECIKLSQKIVSELHETIPQSEISLLVGKMHDCHGMAAKFNEDILLRLLLWKNGYNAKSPQLPSLYKIEKMTTDTILLHLKKNYEKETFDKEDGVKSFRNYLQ